MLSLRDASEIVGARISRQDVAGRVWPPGDLLASGALSSRALCARFGRAGANLRRLRTGSGSSPWKGVDRDVLADDVRDRVADPAVMRQVDTPLCGPIALAFEFARRDPAGYVECARALYEDGEAGTPGGRTIRVDGDLMGGARPTPSDGSGRQIAQGDWLLAAALRDDENWFWDVDGDKIKRGWAGGLATAAEMAGWTEGILALRAAVERPTLGLFGEGRMLREAGEVVAGGGVAFLCIDGKLLKDAEADGRDDDEEQIGWTRADHHPGSIAPASPWTRSADDFAVATHWVVLLGDVVETGPDVEMAVWSWGAEFRLSGTMASAGEYLHAVVLGTTGRE